MIAIRASLRVNDCLTDTIVDSVELAEAERKCQCGASGIYAHAGLLMPAFSLSL